MGKDSIFKIPQGLSWWSVDCERRVAPRSVRSFVAWVDAYADCFFVDVSLLRLLIQLVLSMADMSVN